MPLTVLIKALPGTLPSACYTGPNWAQDLNNDIINGATFQLLTTPTASFYNFGDSTPLPDNRQWPWLRTVAGAPDDWYVYAKGAWLSLYKAVPAGPNGIRWEWEDTEANLVTFDGGEAGVATEISGPFWEVDHNYDGRSSMGPGAIPTSNPAKTLALGEAFGEGAHALTVAELAAHHHDIDIPQENVAGENPAFGNILAATASQFTTKTTKDTGSGDAHNTVHPVRGAFKIKRTIRAFRRIAA